MSKPGLPPDVPVDIDLFFEGGRYLFRVGEGKSLYVYDRDASGVPTCQGACTQEWSPLIASAGAKPVGEWTLAPRNDGTQQWRFRNRPVYMNVNDKPGEASGDGKDAVWHVVTY